MAGGIKLEQRSTVLTVSEAWSCMVASGESKLYLPWLRHLFGAIMGGVIVGGYAHCATIASALMIQWIDEDTYDPASYGWAMFGFALVFTGAFAGIVATGSDLFTSNVAYITSYLLTYPRSGRKAPTWGRILRLFITSYLGNALGCAVITGLVFGLGSDKYYDSELDDWEGDYNLVAPHYYKLLCTMADSKIAPSHPISANFYNAIGCNLFVTMATWQTKYAQDAWGQYVSAAQPVLAFCLGGFQHIIANMFTLFAAYYVDCDKIDLSTIFIRNIIPVTAGNIVGGCLVALCGFGMYGRDHAHEDIPFNKMIDDELHSHHKMAEPSSPLERSSSSCDSDSYKLMTKEI